MLDRKKFISDSKAQQIKNNSPESIKTKYDMIYLISCALAGEKPDETLVEKMNLELLYRMAKSCTLSGIVCMALESADAFNKKLKSGESSEEAELTKKWMDSKNKAVRKVMLLDAERKNIFAFMEKKGIWHMPLKGVILKEFYPKLGMRQMSDNDILYDSNFQKDLCEWMESQGYTVVSVGIGNHDVYEKPPVYNYEMHTSLYGATHPKEWIDYYENVKDRLILTDDTKFGYHFTDEDFYVYIITHAFKHYDGSGTGIRSLIDIYVYLKEKEAIMDWKYISRELARVNVDEFERKCRLLSKKLFSQEKCELTEEENKMLSYFFSSGTYGTLKNNVDNKLQKYHTKSGKSGIRIKMIYLKDRIFPKDEFYKNYAPFVYKHKWLKPFYIVYRFFRGITVKAGVIIQEVKLLSKAGKEKKK